MILHKEYHDLPDGRTIKFSISFNRDKTNWATYEPKKIGYQVNAVPIKRTNAARYSIEEFSAFTGFNDSILEADRQSKKRLAHAISNLHEKQEQYLTYFTNQAVEATK